MTSNYSSLFVFNVWAWIIHFTLLLIIQSDSRLRSPSGSFHRYDPSTSSISSEQKRTTWGADLSLIGIVENSRLLQHWWPSLIKSCIVTSTGWMKLIHPDMGFHIFWFQITDFLLGRQMLVATDQGSYFPLLQAFNTPLLWQNYVPLLGSLWAK